MFERFNTQSRSVIVVAGEEARSLNHSYIGSEHLLLGLLRIDQGTAAAPLASAGVTLEAARRVIDELVGHGERPPPGHIHFTKPAKQCLELSLREALQLGHRYIGTGHLLLGLISQDDSVAVTVLGRLDADLGQLRTRVIQELENHLEDSDDASFSVLAPPLRPPVRPPVRPSVRPASWPSPPPVRPASWPPPPPGIMASLKRIEDRLAAIERHLGIAGEKTGGRSAPGAPGNEAPGNEEAAG